MLSINSNCCIVKSKTSDTKSETASVSTTTTSTNSHPIESTIPQLERLDTSPNYESHSDTFVESNEVVDQKAIIEDENTVEIPLQEEIGLKEKDVDLLDEEEEENILQEKEEIEDENEIEKKELKKEENLNKIEEDKEKF
ncbi:hypothetical protein HK099_000731 [Clydaea vesicula]|uniref:Uncharacterized protein n=1 Tax=Clydaea vesicula TaxID=447962 RepID=A0AAD5XVD1_9FUNG|nr:hypothetical protein HK099_000731 [Clydaea vesicula]